MIAAALARTAIEEPIPTVERFAQIGGDDVPATQKEITVRRLAEGINRVTVSCRDMTVVEVLDERGILSHHVDIMYRDVTVIPAGQGTHMRENPLDSAIKTIEVT
jgi:hypothetical protein